MKIRELSDAEKTARKKYNGMTRREYNAKHGKFAKLGDRETDTNGQYEVVAMFFGNDKPQSAPLPSLNAAIARFQRLSSNENLIALKLIEHVVVYDKDGNATGTRPVTLHSFTKTGQEFANSRIEALWRKKTDGSIVKDNLVMKNTALLKSAENGDLELYRFVAIGGQPWWETRHG